MGDAESKVEEEMIDMYGDELKADVLKVGHHGSKTSSSQKFLQFVNPQITILSCADKSTILPSIEVVDRLTDMQIKIASTANEGNFSMRVNNSEVEFAKAKRKPNYLVIILTIEMILVFIVWKSPFYNPNKKNYYVKGRKFD